MLHNPSWTHSSGSETDVPLKPSFVCRHRMKDCRSSDGGGKRRASCPFRQGILVSSYKDHSTYTVHVLVLSFQYQCTWSWSCLLSSHCPSLSLQLLLQQSYFSRGWSIHVLQVKQQVDRGLVLTVILWQSHHLPNIQILSQAQQMF